MLAHECQIGLVEGPYNTSAFEAAEIGRDQLIAVAGAKHPLAGTRRLTAAAIGNGELVVREPGSGTRTIIERAYLESGIELSPKLSVSCPESIKQLLRLGHGVAWVSRHSVPDELAAGVLVELSISDLTIERELNMIWRREGALSPSARAFRTLVSQVFPNLIG